MGEPLCNAILFFIQPMDIMYDPNNIGTPIHVPYGARIPNPISRVVSMVVQFPPINPLDTGPFGEQLANPAQIPLPTPPFLTLQQTFHLNFHGPGGGTVDLVFISFDNDPNVVGAGFDYKFMNPLGLNYPGELLTSAIPCQVVGP